MSNSDFWKKWPFLGSRKEQLDFIDEVVTLADGSGKGVYDERTLRRKGIPSAIWPGSLWAELGKPPPNTYLKTLKGVSSYYDISYGTLKRDRKKKRLPEPQRIGNTDFYGVNSCDHCRRIRHRSKKRP